MINNQNKLLFPPCGNIYFCTGCTACAAICPHNAIVMKEDFEGFHVPVLIEEKCVRCKLCSQVCPIMYTPKNKSAETVWATWSKEVNDILRSSSGGVAAIVARKFVTEGGIAVGAVMSNFHVYHTIIENIKDLSALQGSKYVQSDMGDCFINTKKFLDTGRNVAFFGTPCQIAGFKNFLRKDYQNLLTLDIICHGVPSPKIYKKYISELKKLYPTAASLTFRDKVQGWNPTYAISLYDTNGATIFRENGQKNVFIQGFLKNIFNRSSCGFCKFTTKDRCGDITLADFWGIQSIDGNFYNKNGTSLCILNSTKGEFYFKKLRDKFYAFKEYKIDNIVQFQQQINTPAEHSSLRKEIFSLSPDQDIIIWLEENIFNKYTLNHKIFVLDIFLILVKKLLSYRSLFFIKKLYRVLKLR